MARRGDLPRFLARVHPRFDVPSRAIVAIGSIAALVAATGTLGQVAAAASFTFLLYYAITNVAALRMRSEAKRLFQCCPGRRADRLSGDGIFPVWAVILAGCAVLVAAIVLRLIVILTRSHGDAAG